MSDNSPTESFVDRIRDLPVIQKVILIFAVLAGAYLIGYFLFQGASEPEVEAEPETTVTQPVTPSATPSASPVDKLPGDLSKDNRPAVSGVDFPDVASGTKLSVDESRQALKVAEKGAIEYTTWGQKETLESRMKRLDKIFDKKSISKGLSLTGSTKITDEYNEEEKLPKYTYYSKSQSISMVGGDRKRFRASVSLEVRFAKVDKGTGKISSEVRQQYPTYTVDVAKQGSEWKVLELLSDGE